MLTQPLIRTLIYFIGCGLTLIILFSPANAAPLRQPSDPLAIHLIGPANVGSGGNITYQLTVTNTGISTVKGLVITDTLPLSTTLLSTTLNGTVLNGVVTWNNLPDLAAGQAITVELVVKAPAWKNAARQRQQVTEPLQPQIVGGEEASPGAWPWQVAVVLASNPSAYDGQKCGGSLIAPEWVMTAAHCMEGVAFGARDVVLGQHRLTGNDGQRINAAWWFIHPNYNAALLDSDIALIRLAHPAELNNAVQMVDLLTTDEADAEAEGVMATVTGWGNTLGAGSSYPDALQQVVMPIVSNAHCEADYDAIQGADNWLTPNMMCAGYDAGGQDSCNGDSGGPLVVPVASNASGWKQAGIVSWGSTICGQKGLPGVYTRVSKFTSWINQMVAADIPPTNKVVNHRYGARANGELTVQGSKMVVTQVTSENANNTAELTITKNGPTLVETGGVITYQVTVANIGLVAATNLVITDTLPARVTFLQANNSGVLQNGLVQWQISRLAAGASQTLQFSVREAATSSRQRSRNLLQPRIFGGQEATPGAWPWQVYVKAGGYQCGGALIDKEWVLTAAHCVYDNNDHVFAPSQVQVTLGAHNINLSEVSQQRLNISTVTPHELYLSGGVDDVALLKLATPATLNDRVQPVTLFRSGAQADPGVQAIVTGWGVTEFGSVSNVLKQVTVPIVTNGYCRQVYINDDEITEGMICAGGQAGQDSCNGDSGGPLVVPNGSGGYVLAGIVSFGGLSTGNACGDQGVPGVYARVSHYINWLDNKIGGTISPPITTTAAVVVNARYGVRADGLATVLGRNIVTTTIITSSGLMVSATGGTIQLDNYTTFTSDAKTFNGQSVGLVFTGSVTSLPTMPNNQTKSLGLAYNLQAIDPTTRNTVNPTTYYTVTLSYRHLLPLTNGIKESQLGLYYYSNSAWHLEPTSQVNQAADTVSATPNHFSLWAVLANTGPRLAYLPLLTKNACSHPFFYNETVLYDMEAINVDKIWANEVCFRPGEGIVVAVLDTGVDLTHPDLKANLVTGNNFIEGSSISPNDDSGHGSNVAGIIAAVANNGKVIGVAPLAKIMPVRVLGPNGGSFAQVADGIIWATDHGARIINMSLGGVTTSDTLEDAVTYAYNKNVFLVAAAGNCGNGSYSSNGCTYIDQPNYPAAYNTVMAVASTNEANSQSSFSNTNNYVEIAAPGSNIYNADKNGGYRSISGTSQATPHVAGLAALILSQNPKLTNQQVRTIIRDTSTDLGTRGWDSFYGYGLINAAAALNFDTTVTAASLSENPPEPTITQPVDAPFVAGEVLVKLKAGATLSEVLQQQSLQPQSVTDTISKISVQVIQVPVGEEKRYVTQLQQSAEVIYAELNYLVQAR